jgi:hypothetical protein
MGVLQTAFDRLIHSLPVHNADRLDLDLLRAFLSFLAPYPYPVYKKAENGGCEASQTEGNASSGPLRIVFIVFIVHCLLLSNILPAVAVLLRFYRPL